MHTFTEQQLTLDNEYALLKTCVGWSPAECKERRAELEDYIHLYKDQIAQLDLIYGLGIEQWPFAEKNPQQLLDVVIGIRARGSAATKKETRNGIKTRLQLLNVGDRTIDGLIDAAIRIWTVVNFRSHDDASVGGGRPNVVWSDEAILVNSLYDVFPRSTTELALNRRRLSPQFTVANMVNICGLRIKWATTLDDHLSLDRRFEVLYVFPCRSWLHAQAENARSHWSVLRCHARHTANGQSATIQVQNVSQEPIQHAPLPKELYEETSRTLDLLFPSWDVKTQRYLKKQRRNFHVVNSGPRSLDLKNYSYWKDKLLELNEDIFLAPPEGWSQLWRDRRDPQKFWTFWIALLVLWLTLVTTAATIIQTWATLTKPG